MVCGICLDAFLGLQSVVCCFWVTVTLTSELSSRKNYVRSICVCVEGGGGHLSVTHFLFKRRPCCISNVRARRVTCKQIQCYVFGPLQLAYISGARCQKCTILEEGHVANQIKGLEEYTNIYDLGKIYALVLFQWP